MPTTLTQRYVDATVRGVDETQRADVERELHATIEDMIEGRLAAGEPDRARAERAVLIELGDPARLAASYTGRGLYLIGPESFPDWWRLVKLLLAIVVPLATGASVLGRAWSDDVGLSAIGTLVAHGLLTGVGIAVHIVFWTTLVFAVLERQGQRLCPFPSWDPDQLPDPQHRVGLADTLMSIAWAAVLAVALLWQHLDSPLIRDGASIPVLDPALASPWLPWLLAVFVAEMVFAWRLYRTGAWTSGLAAANIGLNLAFAVPVLYLLWAGRLFNDRFVDVLTATDGLGDIERSGPVVLALSIVAVTAWDSAYGVVKARARRPGRTPAALAG